MPACSFDVSIGWMSAEWPTANIHPSKGNLCQSEPLVDAFNPSSVMKETLVNNSNYQHSLSCIKEFMFSVLLHTKNPSIPYAAHHELCPPSWSTQWIPWLPILHIMNDFLPYSAHNESPHSLYCTPWIISSHMMHIVNPPFPMLYIVNPSLLPLCSWIP